MVSTSGTWKFFRRKPIAILCGVLLFVIWSLDFYLQHSSDRDSLELPPSSIVAGNEEIPPVELSEPPEPLKPSEPVESSESSESSENTAPDDKIDEPPRDLSLHVFDDAAIRDLCANAPWDSGADLVINCEGRVGGIGMTLQT